MRNELSKPVLIARYNPQWPVLYEHEKSRIIKALVQKALAIEHIGSTSIPGLGSKNIVDMMLGLQGPEDAEECLSRLMNIGYNDATSEPGDPDWYYCLGTDLAAAYCHLHLIRYESNRWTNHLLFRDYLRTHADVAQNYNQLKNQLAIIHRNDRQAYTQAKASFIESILNQANQQKTDR